MPGTQHIHEDQMREFLREAFAQDRESDLLWRLTQRIRDPGSPATENKRQRLHPLLVIFAALLVIAFATFLYFAYFQP
jgi:hypothetical protein